MNNQVITLPHNFTPRNYQESFVYEWEKKKRLILVAHRRAGKDKMVFANLPAKMLQRVGTYFYFLPTYNQARKVIWNGSDKDGFKFLDHFPKGIVKSINQTEMTITLTNGSILQMVGADNIDRIVGTNPVGCVFSEYALMKKEVWDLISPILLENGGWAVFIFTPRGKNHAHDLLQKAQKDKNWHVEILPVSKTKALSDEQIAEAKMNMTDALFRQEYECFPKGTDIITKNGIKDISEIKVGDLVLTHANRYRKVLRTFAKEYKGNLIKINSYGNNKDLLCTPEHPIRTTVDGVNYSWKIAGMFNKKEMVTMPKPMLKDKPIVSNSIATLIAWFIAEGSYSRNQVSFSLNSNEIEYQKEIATALLENGYQPKFARNNNCIVIYVNSVELGEFLVGVCGSGAKNKRIPFEIIATHEQLVYDILIKGDGCYLVNNRDSYITISKNLAYDVQLLAHSLSYTASITEDKCAGKGIILGRKVNFSDKYTIRINRAEKHNNFHKMKTRKYSITSEILKIEEQEFDGVVYNFEVEIDNSYVANSKVVHNCEFEDNVGAVYRNVKSRTYPSHEWTENPAGVYQIGVDLAKSDDFTVITPFDITTFRVAPQDSFNQIDYTLQKTKIEAAYHRFGRGRVIMDSTGVGVPIVDDLLNKGINVAPFTFSYNSRNELLVNLQILLEQGKVQIPDDPELIEELESAFWDTTASGRSKIVVPDGKHDDRLMSLALAVWDIPTRPVTAMSQQRVQESGGIEPFYGGFGYN